MFGQEEVRMAGIWLRMWVDRNCYQGEGEGEGLGECGTGISLGCRKCRMVRYVDKMEWDRMRENSRSSAQYAGRGGVL